MEPTVETPSEVLVGNDALLKKHTDDPSEKADSGMDEDSQHSSNNDAKSHGDSDSSDDEDVVQIPRKKIHRLLDDDSEDSRPLLEESKALEPSLKTAEEALDTIFKENSGDDEAASSDDSDNETLLNTIKKKTKRVVNQDTSDEEDTGTQKSEMGSQKEGPMFGNGDLFDAEDSEQERKSGDESAQDSNSDSNSDSDEGFDESKIDPKLLKQLKKGAAKKDPSQTARGKRKAKEEALLSMHSETQRMVREARVQIPYHNPTPRPLQDFLGRAMRKQEQYRALRGSKSSQKVKVVQDVIEKSKFTPKCLEDNENKSMEGTSDLLQRVSAKLSHDLKPTEIKEGSQQTESSESSEETLADNSDCVSKESCVQSDSNLENFKCDVVSERLSGEKVTGDMDVDDDSLPDLDNNTDSSINPTENKTDSNLGITRTVDSVGNSSQSLKASINDSMDTECCENVSSVTNSEKMEGRISGNYQCKTDQQTNSAKTQSLDICSENNISEVASQNSEVEVSGDKLKDKLAKSASTTLQAVVPELPSLSKITGSPNSFIDLDEPADVSAGNPGVQKLMDRFLKHAKKKEKKACSDVDISIIQKDSGCADKQELKESSFTYHVTQEEENPLMKFATPGAKLMALKSQLQLKMKARREEARQKRQEVYDLDNEEGYEAENEVLDDEAELTDQSDTDEEEIEGFEEQFGEEEEEIETETKEKNPFMDEEAEEDEEEDVVGDEEELNLRLDLSDGEEEEAQHSDNDEIRTSLSAKKKPRVLQISDDEDDSRDVTKMVNQKPVEQTFLAPKQLAAVNTGDESLEEDAFSPFSKHLSSMANTQKETLSLPVEDSQDLYGASECVPATSVVTQSNGIHFYLEDSQSQMLDADGFLKMGSSTKKPKQFDLVEPSATQDNMDELLGLCSGQFAGTQAEDKKTSCKSLFGTENTQVSSTQGNMDELLGLCSGRFVSSNKEDEIPSKSGRKRKSPLDEDEEEDPDEKFEIKSDDEDFEQHSEKDVLSDDDEKVEDMDEDSDEGDVDGEVERNFSGFTVKNKHGKIRKEFVDEEAELSGSEYDSDENLDLAEEDDVMEQEEGDKDKLVSEDELRNQVGRAHLKQLIDEDKRELMRFQEMYLPDGDLHSEGGGRARRFRWKNIDDDTQQDLFDNESDGEKEDEEGENDFKWRKERFEREKWLQEQQENEKMEDTDSQFVKFGKVFLKRRDSDSGSGPQRKMSVEAEKPSTKKEAPNTPTSVYKLPKQKRGSFLSRDKDTLAKIAEMSKPAKINLTGARNSRNFVFQVISPEKEKVQPKKGATPTTGPKVRKAHTPKQSQKPAAKKPRLEDKSFSQNSIFHHM